MFGKTLFFLSGKHHNRFSDLITYAFAFAARSLRLVSNEYVIFVFKVVKISLENENIDYHLIAFEDSNQSVSSNRKSRCFLEPRQRFRILPAVCLQAHQILRVCYVTRYSSIVGVFKRGHLR